MVAGFLKMHLRRDKIDEAVEFWNSTLSAETHNNPFLKEKLNGRLLLVDRATGHAYSIGLWESPEASEEFQKSEFFTRLLAGLNKCSVRPATREQFDVAGGSLESTIRDKLAKAA